MSRFQPWLQAALMPGTALNPTFQFHGLARSYSVPLDVRPVDCPVPCLLGAVFIRALLQYMWRRERSCADHCLADMRYVDPAS